MTFDPNGFLDLADELLATLSGAPIARSNRDQARVRASISRAYYGAYLSARERLTFLGRITPTGTHRDHQVIVDALGGVGSDLGGKLDRLRAKRNQADYNLNPRGLTLASGRLWLSIAQEIIREVSQMTS